MKILKYKKVFLIIAAVMALAVIGAVSVFGFNLSVDFKGGSVYEIQYTKKIPSVDEIKIATKDSNLSSAIIQKIGEDSFVIKTAELSDSAKSDLKKHLTFNDKYKFTEIQSKTVGPSVSSELAKKSIFAIIFVSLAIVLFIAYTFRKVSKPVSSFKFGLVAIVALIHDILIPVGVFSVLGYFSVAYQIDVLFITALLAILGFSVNDTIVVFDRIRENLSKANQKNQKVEGEYFEKIVGQSLSETIVRSLNTSFTTLVVLLFLFFMGGENTKSFALVLIIGVMAGTYSSIFIASPLLVYISKFQSKKPKKEKKKNKNQKIDPSDITM